MKQDRLGERKTNSKSEKQSSKDNQMSQKFQRQKKIK